MLPSALAMRVTVTGRLQPILPGAITLCVRLQQGVQVLGGYLSPVHTGYGKPGLAPNAARVRLCRAAAADSTWVDVDVWEAEQPEHMRTLHVLRSVSERLRAALGMAGACSTTHCTAHLTALSRFLTCPCLVGLRLVLPSMFQTRSALGPLA
jgi:hypothetical protein